MNPSSYRTSHIGAARAARYDELYEHGYFRQLWREIEAPLLTAELEALTGGGAVRALDFACGTARVTGTVAKMFPDCTGIDISHEMLEAARRRCPDVRFIQADLTTDRQGLSSSFDVVTAFRFFLNAEDRLRAEALDAINDVLTPDGVLIVSVQWASTSPAGLVYRLRNRVRGTSDPRTASAAEMQRLFAAHDFDVLRVRRYGLWPRLSRHHGVIGRRGMRLGEAALAHVAALGPLAQNFLVVARKGRRC